MLKTRLNSVKPLDFSDISFEAIPTFRPSNVIAGCYSHSAVWRRALFKLKIARSVQFMKNEQLMYGIVPSKNLKYHHVFSEAACLVDNSFERTELPWYVMSPEGSFQSYWSIVLIWLMLYTAIVMPFRIGFFDVVFFDTWLIIDIVNDGLFFTDVIIQCFMSYKLPEGDYQRSLRAIVVRYLKSWLLFDLCSCFPFYLVEYHNHAFPSSGKYNQLARLLRLPRFYKLLRIFRLAKDFNGKSTPKFVFRVQTMLQMNSRKL